MLPNPVLSRGRIFSSLINRWIRQWTIAFGSYPRCVSRSCSPGGPVSSLDFAVGASHPTTKAGARPMITALSVRQEEKMVK
jgi:hypothetical protein